MHVEIGMTASAEDIAHQQTLLSTYRRNLQHYLKQQATLGEAFAPPGVAHGISEARTNIQRIKQILHNWNVPVEDHPDDGDPISPTARPTQPANLPGMPDRVRLREVLSAAFSDDELRDLVFDLGWDYENLPGSGKSSKARELVAMAERHGRYAELVEIVRRLRKNAGL
jgi:hypothetical protein